MEASFPQDTLGRAIAAAPTERRHARRHDVPLSGRWIAEGRWIHVLIENISHHGAALSALVPLRVGEVGTLKLDDFDTPVPCRVQWARDATAGVAFHLTAEETERMKAYIRRHTAKGQISFDLCPDPTMPA